jgi:hypothetical protein
MQEVHDIAASSAARSSWSAYAVVACAGVLACLCGLYPVRTFDTFFHLAAGRLILEQGAVPSVDPFSFTFRGAPWHNHSWGFQALLAQLYALGGYALLSVWQAVTAGLVWALAWWSARSERSLWGVAAVLAVVPATAFREVLEARPHMLGFVCLASSLHLTNAVVRGARPPRWLLWLLPTQALWCVVHGSHVLLLAELLLAMAALLVARRFRLAACFLLALVVATLGVALLAPAALQQGGRHAASAFLETHVSEWYPVSLSDLVRYWPGRAFLGIATLSVTGVLFGLARGWNGVRSALASELYAVVLLVVFVLLACSSRRMLALFALGVGPIWLPFAARGARALGSVLVRPRSRVASKLRDVMLSAATWNAPAGLCLGALAAATLIQPTFPLGLGLMPGRVPERAVQHIRASARIERLYNAYNFGGYLMWEGVPAAGVFIDGRAITVYPAAFLEAFERAYDDVQTFERLAKHYAVDGVLLPTTSVRTARLRRYLDRAPGWRTSYRDELAVVYENSSR